MYKEIKMLSFKEDIHFYLKIWVLSVHALYVK